MYEQLILQIEAGMSQKDGAVCSLVFKEEIAEHSALVNGYSIHRREQHMNTKSEWVCTLRMEDIRCFNSARWMKSFRSYKNTTLSVCIKSESAPPPSFESDIKYQ